jgi:hypothetical protein
MRYFTILGGMLLLACAGPAAAPPGEGRQDSGPPAAVELLEDNTEGLLRAPVGGIQPVAGRDFRDFYSGVCSLRVSPPRGLFVRPAGWSYPVADKPGPGQYRYLRFAWKRVGGNAILLRLYTAGGPAGRPRYVTYVAGARPGTKVSRIQKTISLGDAAPAEWTVVTRDLFQDVGPVTLTGMVLLPLTGGEAALLDHVYLGRSVADLDRASAAAFGKGPLAEPLKRPRLEELWRDLAGRDVAAAGRAVRALVAGRRESVPFLAAQLTERPPLADDRRILKLIADLDDNRFRVREEATRELAKIGEPAVPLLRAALARAASLEVQRRCQQLLDRRKVEEAGLTVDQLRLVRAIRVLEWCGTAEARQALERAADGVLASAGLAADARRALERARKGS